MAYEEVYSIGLAVMSYEEVYSIGLAVITYEKSLYYWTQRHDIIKGFHYKYNISTANL